MLHDQFRTFEYFQVRTKSPVQEVTVACSNTNQTQILHSLTMKFTLFGHEIVFTIRPTAESKNKDQFQINSDSKNVMSAGDTVYADETDGENTNWNDASDDEDSEDY